MSHLDLYVVEECPACQDARVVAQRAARAFPSLVVTIIDLDEPGARVPANVFAVPTFCLDGRIVSLGTPDWERLCVTIRAALTCTRDAA